MKNILTLILYLFILQSALAQDIIYKKNGDKIEANIVEVGIDEIKYKRYTATDGPVYLILKNDIFMIEYADGSKDVFNQESSAQKSPETQTEGKPTTVIKNKDGGVSGSTGARVGLVAGFTLANMKEEPSNQSLNSRPGLQVGLSVEVPFSSQISLQTGLLFSQRGLRNNEEVTEFGETYDKHIRFNLSYLDIPINAKATFDLGNVSIYGLSGLYLGYGIRGSFVEDRMLPTGDLFEDSELIEWGTELKRMDYGLNIGAGLQFNSLQVGITYSLGLANISASVNDDFFDLPEVKLSNRLFGLTVQYYLVK